MCFVTESMWGKKYMLQVCYGQRQFSTTAFLSVFSFNRLTLSEKCIKYSPACCAEVLNSVLLTDV